MKIKKLRVRSPKGSSLATVSFMEELTNDFDNKTVWKGSTDVWDGVSTNANLLQLCFDPTDNLRNKGEPVGGFLVNDFESEGYMRAVQANPEEKKVLYSIDSQHRLYRMGNRTPNIELRENGDMDGNSTNLTTEKKIFFDYFEFGYYAGSRIDIKATQYVTESDSVESTDRGEHRWTIDDTVLGALEVGKDYMFCYGLSPEYSTLDSSGDSSLFYVSDKEILDTRYIYL